MGLQPKNEDKLYSFCLPWVGGVVGQGCGSGLVWGNGFGNQFDRGGCHSSRAGLIGSRVVSLGVGDGAFLGLRHIFRFGASRPRVRCGGNVSPNPKRVVGRCIVGGAGGGIDFGSSRIFCMGPLSALLGSTSLGLAIFVERGSGDCGNNQWTGFGSFGHLAEANR